ncbi:GNAT family N-acetyltransferase [Arthrobacter sp. ISL-30]|uniref:GNAT family N-acetyltransferase n=1 Tax=Arthrobacter sp. ISL-30 TaxID=2819109 RepID=UPI001BE6C0B2|nr:GNAT family N-acetyltransferase [Arthrobacter sp. ISL-30]MBT2515409.1 acetyltransferase [Arthrobacter sp. ISL-30]
MIALGWNRDLLLGNNVLRAATVADAEGVTALMAEPDVEQWWHQNWDESRWAECLRGLIEDPGSLPLVLIRGDKAQDNGAYDGAQGDGAHGERVAGYVEVYRVAGDVLGQHIRHDQTDLGMHVALGETSRGQGLGGGVIRAVLGATGEILEGCNRLVAEPDKRNTRSIRAFKAAGFESGDTVQLPDKTARLMEARVMEAQPNSLTVGPGYASIPWYESIPCGAGQQGAVL